MIPRSVHTATPRVLPAWLILSSLCLANLAFGADPQPVASKPAPVPVSSAPSFSKFQYISDWNIFDANRVGRGSGEASAPPPQVISLVGTLQYEKGLFALFTGTDPSNQKAAKVGDTISDFTVAQVTANAVDLVRAGKHVSLDVGQELSKRVGGDWIATGSPASPAASPGTIGLSTTAAPAVPGDASDILKRLMEKRQQQLKQ